MSNVTTIVVIVCKFNYFFFLKVLQIMNCQVVARIFHVYLLVGFRLTPPTLFLALGFAAFTAAVPAFPPLFDDWLANDKS